MDYNNLLQWLQKGASNVGQTAVNDINAAGKYIGQQSISGNPTSPTFQQAASVINSQPQQGNTPLQNVLSGNIQKIPGQATQAATQYMNDVKAGQGYKDIAPMATTDMVPYSGANKLTTGVLDKLQGKTYVSPQYISDLTKMPTVKQAESNVVNSILQKYGEMDKIPVKQFASDVENQLLPLNRKSLPNTRYEEINLPESSNATNYNENIYESPIETSAGAVHFSSSVPTAGSDKYFAHTRTEDVTPNLPASWSTNPNIYSDPNTGHLIDKTTGQNLTQATTRKVLELQSDLFQKGRLESSIEPYLHIPDKEVPQPLQGRINQLAPYTDTWYQRVSREEIKKAAQDGMKNLQFPTGQTAMRVEGLGQNTNWYNADSHNRPLTPDSLNVGQQITTQGGGNHIGASDSHTIIANLGDGKFRAVQNIVPENDYNFYKYIQNKGLLEKDGSFPEMSKLLPKLDTEGMGRLSGLAENYDISGKVDKQNPIYKFYESEVGKYLKNNHDAQRITDENGNDWWNVPVNSVMAKNPIKAYAAAPLGLATSLAGMGYNQKSKKK